ELDRAGIQNPGPSALGLSDLGGPDLDWVSLARGFGVEGQKAHTVNELKDAMKKGLAHRGPYLIEAVLA
ncbi:MAG: thiamine pyrophosphate-dependent enzyme, partial [Alphaproteobacteria bacterium]|nr:thiamine pyrophosphate-dependent enzyme [Alphaproteobacteria bacterium]